MRTVASSTLVCACLLALFMVTPLIAAADAKPRVDGKERAIVRAINYQRGRNGLAGLRTSARLARAADFHSWEMLDANYFAHESRDGSPFDKRVRRYANHNALGETLAMLGGCGRRAARKIVRMWMNSPPHRAVLLSGSYSRVGIGSRTGSLDGNRTCVVTADFGSKK